MIFSRLWIIRRFVFILFLMTDFVFNYGVTPCTGYRSQQKGNSSSGAGTRGFESGFFDDYFKSVLNKSKALEEAIYSDILNNLRNLVRTENNQSVESTRKEYKTHDVRGKNEKVKCDNRNKTTENKRGPVNSSKTDVFLSGGGETRSEEGSKFATRNVTLRNSPGAEREYFLGYSGNPFGNRRPLSGALAVLETDPLGKEITDPRKKRSVLHLYNMVLCTTGCNPFAYKGYGCYCGFLGSGFVVDGIDSCCKMHDWCYNSAGCPMFLEYFVPYLWQCHHRQPLCAIDHGYYGGPGSCAQRLCECDRQLALCLRRYPCPSTKAFCTSSPWRLLQNILML